MWLYNKVDCRINSRVKNNWTDWTNLLMAVRLKDWCEFVEIETSRKSIIPN